MKKYKIYKSILMCFILSYFFIEPSIAQTVEEQQKPQEYYDSSGNFRFDAAFFVGGGSKKFDLLKTTEGDIVTLSPGGGAGGKISAGYCFSSNFNINVELGTQNSTLSKEVSNAKGDFSRKFLLGTLRLKIPVSVSGSINLGGGAGMYMGGEMDVDASKISGGAHNIYQYKNATGFHFMLEYEHFLYNLSFMSATWSWGIGVKHYRVTYDLESMTQNGKSIPLSQMPQSLKDETMKLNGNGTDAVFFITMYL